MAPCSHHAHSLGLNVSRFLDDHPRDLKDGLNDQIMRLKHEVGAVVVRRLDPSRESLALAYKPTLKLFSSVSPLHLSAPANSFLLPVNTALKTVKLFAPPDQGLRFSVE